MEPNKKIIWFEKLRLDDLPLVGGKNASLGEMVQALQSHDIKVPAGFALTASMYWDFLRDNDLDDAITDQLAALDNGGKTLAEVGAAIRALIGAGEFSASQRESIVNAYQMLCRRSGKIATDVAVRSSATAEDLPTASFAGQQESYLNICGAEALLAACKKCYMSLYTDRAIAYRQQQGFEHQAVALSVGVQQMVHADKACSGVMFTLDPDSGFPDVVSISGCWGLGETVVKGRVNPDSFLVYKPFLYDWHLVPIIQRTIGSKLEKMVYGRSGIGTKTLPTSQEERNTQVLTDQEILTLARWGLVIERHYDGFMDIEWAKDGDSGDLYIVQARPETVESNKDVALLDNYQLQQTGEVLVEGTRVGSAITRGKIVYRADAGDCDDFPEGAILLAERTDPDWVPIMRRAAGIITDTGGPTSHAAIVCRELKVPAIIGTGNGTTLLKDGMEVTLDCTDGAMAKVYAGLLDYRVNTIALDKIPKTTTELMINVAMPDTALRWWQLPTAGIGLTRIEFIIADQIKIHPMALLHPEAIDNTEVLEEIESITHGVMHKELYFVEQLAQGIGKIAASCYPRPAIIRFSDFKSNEYRGLLGGAFFESEEPNPMLGLRGAARYYHPRYREAFELECQAIKQVRDTMGFSNIIAMIPFCRTVKEADEVLGIMAGQGLQRGVKDFQVYMMCEVPSNVILAEQFARHFDGFSIGSNDLTQLVLGIDRDASELNPLFNSSDEAVKRMIVEMIKVGHQHGCKVGLCGQAPSDSSEFAAFLVGAGIDSISLNPDAFIAAAESVYRAEQSDIVVPAKAGIQR